MKLSAFSAVFALCIGLPVVAHADGVQHIDKGGVPSGIKLEGDFVNGVTWSDKNGDNVVVFSRKMRDHNAKGVAAAQLFVNHWAKPKGKQKLMRRVQDHVDECEVDIVLDFVPEALAVTDLDSDQIKEVTFAYRINCRGDVSPDGLKLLLLEGGQKYIIRGSGHFPCDASSQPDDPGCKGEKVMDASLKKGPKAFLDHTSAIWDKVSIQRMD